MGEILRIFLTALWWVIDGPAQLIGYAAAWAWPIIILYLAWRVGEAIHGQRPSRSRKAAAIAAGVYVSAVLYVAANHAAIAFLHSPYQSGF